MHANITCMLRDECVHRLGYQVPRVDYRTIRGSGTLKFFEIWIVHEFLASKTFVTPVALKFETRIAKRFCLSHTVIVK